MTTYYPHAGACGERLRRRRELQAASLKDVAQKARLSYQYLSRVEKGEVNTPIETLVRIAEALEMPLAEVLGVADDVFEPCEPEVRSPLAAMPFIVQRCVRQGNQARRAVDALLEDLHLLQHA
jgi:transcriptional regulator with XRE-family HTH domain